MADELERQPSEVKAKQSHPLDERDSESAVRAREVAEAVERLKALRRTFGKAPLDEILASRHEGHKY
jgi:hypothetical protein